MGKFVSEGLKVEKECEQDLEGCTAIPAMNALAITMHTQRYPSPVFEYVIYSAFPVFPR